MSSFVRSATVASPATIGNVGPGFDVLGLALDKLEDQITISLFSQSLSDKKNSDFKDSVRHVEGMDQNLVPMDPDHNSCIVAARSFLQIKNLDYRIELKLRRMLPLGGGLGSSAAAAVGGALAAAYASEATFSKEEIIEAALVAESSVAGRHLDNIAPCLWGGLTSVLENEGKTEILSLTQECDWFFAMLTPNMLMETKKSRALLPEKIGKDIWVPQLASSVALVHSFQKKDFSLLKLALKDYYAEPARSQLIPNFSKIQKAAIEAGAAACTISGGGPTIFAICRDERQGNEVLEAMSHQLSEAPKLKQLCRLSKQGARKI